MNDGVPKLANDAKVFGLGKIEEDWKGNPRKLGKREAQQMMLINSRICMLEVIIIKLLVHVTGL